MLKSTKCVLTLLSAATALSFASSAAAQLAIDWSKRDQWQWFGADVGNLAYTPICMDGSSTGFAIYVPSSWNSPSGTNDNVMYWFDGGGDCWDFTTCSNPVPNIQTLIGNPGALPPAPFVFRQSFTRDIASGCTSSMACYQNNLAWYTTNSANQPDANLMLSPKAILAQGVFDHSTGPANINVFKNYLQVFIPYCTGDIHIGYKHDTTDSSFRKASQKYFNGLYNAYYDVSFADETIRVELNAAPPKVVVGGGSAGGFASLLLYGMIRGILPTTEKITTISDAGVPYYQGFPNSGGTAWYSSTYQGYAGLPTPRTGCGTYPNKNGSQCASTTAVTYQQAFMSDAWGTTWQTYAQQAIGTDFGAITPAGSPGPFLPMAEVAFQEAFYNRITTTDRFYILTGQNDWLIPVLFSMYPMGTSGQTATIDAAQSQLINVWSFGSTIHQMKSTENGFGTYAGTVPWIRHHGFLTNDVSTWDNTKAQAGGYGSGVSQWLNAIGGW